MTAIDDFPALCAWRDAGEFIRIRDGDIVVIYGSPKALEHAESVLLAG